MESLEVITDRSTKELIFPQAICLNDILFPPMLYQ